MDVSIVVVGDEILSGHVQDANAHFITARAATNGHRVRRIVVVPDDPRDIASEVAREAGSTSEVVFVCGGIGPTHDDRTMEGVAAGLDRPLERSAVLSEWIDTIVARIEARGIDGDPWGVEALRKMELAPAGAEVIPAGAFIPAVVIRDERAHVVVLPGPPRELQAIFLSVVEARFLAPTGEDLASEEITHPFFESTVAKVLTELQGRYPATSIGSYPQARHTLVRVSGPVDDARACAAELRAHLDSLATSEEGRRLLAYIDERRARRDSASSES